MNNAVSFNGVYSAEIVMSQITIICMILLLLFGIFSSGLGIIVRPKMIQFSRNNIICQHNELTK